MTDARKWLPGSLGSFDCRERSGAFDLAARAREKGRGKRQVKKRSGAAAGESSQGSATGSAESEPFEASSFKGNQTAQSPRRGIFTPMSWAYQGCATLLAWVDVTALVST